MEASVRAHAKHMWIFVDRFSRRDLKGTRKKRVRIKQTTDAPSKTYVALDCAIVSSGSIVLTD